VNNVLVVFDVFDVFDVLDQEVTARPSDDSFEP
jgi:hypothetical protein